MRIIRAVLTPYKRTVTVALKGQRFAHYAPLDGNMIGIFLARNSFVTRIRSGNMVNNNVISAVDINRVAGGIGSACIHAYANIANDNIMRIVFYMNTALQTDAVAGSGLARDCYIGFGLENNRPQSNCAGHPEYNRSVGLTYSIDDRTRPAVTEVGYFVNCAASTANCITAGTFRAGKGVNIKGIADSGQRKTKKKYKSSYSSSLAFPPRASLLRKIPIPYNQDIIIIPLPLWRFNSVLPDQIIRA